MPLASVAVVPSDLGEDLCPVIDVANGIGEAVP
jgi:hypothetical protein